MTDYGMIVSNASADIQIDSTYSNYAFLKQGFAYTRTHNVATYPHMVGTFPYQNKPPIITFKPPYIYPTAIAGITATQVHFQAQRLHASQHVQYQVYTASISTPATWGMNIYNASGAAVFSSEDRHLKITSVVTGTYKAVPAAGGGYAVKHHTLASKNNDFMISNKGGVEQALGDGTPVGQTMAFRSYAWGIVAANASQIIVGGQTISMATVFQNEGITETFEATYQVIGVPNAVGGKYRQWGRPFITTNPLTPAHMVVIATKTTLDGGEWPGADAGIIKVAVWQEDTNGSNDAAIRGVASFTSSILIAAQQPYVLDNNIAHIYKSVDRGMNWSRSNLDGRVGEHKMLVMRGLNSTSAVIGTYNSGVGVNATAGIWRTGDQGDTWSLAATIGNTYWITKQEESIVWAGYYRGAGIPYRSKNYGNNWAQVGTTLIGNLEFNPLNASIILGIKGSSDGKVYRSVNGGQSWASVANFNTASNVHPEPNVQRVVFLDATYALAIGQNTGQFWRSKDAGLTFPDLIDEWGYGQYDLGNIYDIIKWPSAVATDLYWIQAAGGIYRNYELYHF